MTFGQAISSGLANLTNFEGRSSRAAFWYWVLLIFIVHLVDYLIFWRLGGFLGFIGFLISLVLLLATLAVGCRRLHDTGKSGWLQLLWIIPCIGEIILIVFWVMPGDPAANTYGPPPTA